MRQHHYLGFAGMVGESLRYVAERSGQWLALLGWQAAALKCRPRDRWTCLPTGRSAGPPCCTIRRENLGSGLEL
jgi:hypothetical protein